MTDARPMTPDEAREAALAWILRSVDGPLPTVEAWPVDVPDASRAPRGERERRPALAAHARPEPQAPPLCTWDAVEVHDACDPVPRAVVCEVDAVPAFAVEWHPVLVRGDVVPVFDSLGPVRGALLADLGKLLDAVDSGRAPLGPVPMPRYYGRTTPRAVEVAPLPVVPELVPGADVVARRATIDRAAVLIRGTVELAALLDTAPPDVAARARAALVKAMTPAK